LLFDIVLWAEIAQPTMGSFLVIMLSPILYHQTSFAALARQQLKAARRTQTQLILLRVDVDGRP